MPDALTWPKRALTTAQLYALARAERRVPFLPVNWIERLQRRRLRAIVRHAYETVPFYRRTMDEFGLRPADFESVADLARLPLIGAAAVRSDPDQFTSTRYAERDRHAFYSSGSVSSIPKQIWWDEASLLLKLPRAERDRVVVAQLAGRQRTQRQLYIMTPSSTELVQRDIWRAHTIMQRPFVQRRRLDPALPFEAAIEEINANRPHVVYSCGSYADQFFRFVADRQLPLAVPSVWVYGGDLLPTDGRELIERTFGCALHSTYQSTETGRLGFQCPVGHGFHLNVDLCALRIVDETGQTVAPGQVGEVVVSNLHNRAMVLLNYHLDDRAALATAPCPCGRTLPLLDRLEGRRSEIIALADGRTLSSLTVRVLFKQELKPTLKAQVVQSAPGQIRWLIVPFASADRAAVRRAFLERAESALGPETQVAVDFVEDIPRTAGGKFLQVVTDPVASPARSGVPGDGDRHRRAEADQ